MTDGQIVFLVICGVVALSMFKRKKPPGIVFIEVWEKFRDPAPPSISEVPGEHGNRGGDRRVHLDHEPLRSARRAPLTEARMSRAPGLRWRRRRIG